MLAYTNHHHKTNSNYRTMKLRIDVFLLNLNTFLLQYLLTSAGEAAPGSSLTNEGHLAAMLDICC